MSNSYVFSMNEFVLNSVGPSVIQELTSEQEHKIVDELQDIGDQNLVVVQEIKSEHEWYCEKSFSLKQKESWSNLLFDFGGVHSFYIHGTYTLNDGKTAFLINENSKQVIKIFDVNLGTLLLEINSIEIEKRSDLFFITLCKLPENKIACLMNTQDGYSKKIKILDLDSGMVLNDFLINKFQYEGKKSYQEICITDIVYLSIDKLILMVTEKYHKGIKVFLLILDLNSGKILKKFDFKKDTSIYTNDIKRLIHVLPYGNIAFVCEALLEINPISETSKKILEWIGCLLNNAVTSIHNLSDNKFISGQWEGKIKVWRNDQFNYKEIKEALNKNNFGISDLQNIILDYVGKDWVIEKTINFENKIEHRINKMYLLKDQMAITVREDYVQKVFILDLNSGEHRQINFGKKFRELRPLENGNIMLVFENGSVEIWTNTPKIKKDKLNDSCIIC